MLQAVVFDFVRLVDGLKFYNEEHINPIVIVIATEMLNYRGLAHLYFSCLIVEWLNGSCNCTSAAAVLMLS